MPQSLVRILGHLVFSTKKRLPLIDAEIRPALHAYMAGILEREGCREILIGGTEDHVHVLLVLAKGVAPSKIVEVLKKRSSSWVKQQSPRYRDFYWQVGYALFSVSPSKLPDVARYIAHQEKHHRRASFQEELRALLKKHDVDFDERYLWD